MLFVTDRTKMKQYERERENSADVKKPQLNCNFPKYMKATAATTPAAAPPTTTTRTLHLEFL